jgi:hypothetical protein
LFRSLIEEDYKQERKSKAKRIVSVILFKMLGLQQLFTSAMKG